MKILMTADTLGGVWSYAMQLCAALRPAGVEVALATMGASPSPGQRAELRGKSNVQLYESAFRLEWMSSPWENLEDAADWLLALESRVRPDVVHLNHLVHAELPWRAPVITVAHSCVFSWWWAVHRCRPGRDWDRYFRRVKTSLHTANCVVAPTRALLAALFRHYGPIAEAQVIPNARAACDFRRVRKLPLVFSAGRLWDQGKNVRALCEVAPALAWPVFVAGATTSPDGTSENLPNVSQLGELSPMQLRQWLAASAIYAAPARYEPFGLTPLEAALSGCALVLGDIESLREVWEDAAVYVLPDSPSDLREQIATLIEQPYLLAGYAQRGYEHALQFNPQRQAASYMNLYRNTCRRKEMQPCASYSSITH
jgi:glycosyltransferase involved in cell wall biosynthesis